MEDSIIISNILRKSMISTEVINDREYLCLDIDKEITELIIDYLKNNNDIHIIRTRQKENDKILYKMFTLTKKITNYDLVKKFGGKSNISYYRKRFSI